MLLLHYWQQKRQKLLHSWGVGMLSGLLIAGLVLTLLFNIQRDVDAQETNRLYLPLVMRAADPILTRPEPFGVEASPGRLASTQVRQRAGQLKSTWVRFNTVSWRDVQPTRELPVADWNWQAESMQKFEQEVKAAATLGLTPTVIVDDAPAWATIHETSCGALREDRFQDFARFMQELIKRYGKPPYNVRYWELGNEIDVDYRLVQKDNLFGCWGVKEDAYYGGEHYGRMLNVVTPAMKRVDPNAQVLIGGLLLNSPNTTDPGSGRPELFLEGILRAGAGANFDFVPFHAYPPYQGRMFDSDLQDTRWADRGGMTLGKASFLRETMQRYGVEKPLMLNEAGLLYYGDQNAVPDDFLQTQADYIVRLFARSLSVDIKAVMWYTLNGPGWRNSGLLDQQQQPRPVFVAYQQLIRQAQQAIDTREVSAEYGSGIEAYRFRKFSRNVDVLWSQNGAARQFTVPTGSFLAAYTRDGAKLEPVSQSDQVLRFEVGSSPVYIQRR